MRCYVLYYYTNVEILKPSPENIIPYFLYIAIFIVCQINQVKLDLLVRQINWNKKDIYSEKENILFLDKILDLEEKRKEEVNLQQIARSLRKERVKRKAEKDVPMTLM